MDDYVEITIDVFDVTGQRANVRKTLTVAGFIDEILREFDDLERKTPEAYGLFLKGQDKPLDRDRTLSQLDIQTHDELEFKYARSSGRGKIVGGGRAFFRDDKTQKEFDILWQPAIIGRQDADPAHNELLAVDLSAFPEGRRISRQHAQVTFVNDRYYLESLSPNNPTYLNDEKSPIIEKRRLESGDKIRLGKNIITITFVQQL